MAEIPPIAISIFVEMGQFNAGITEAKAKMESLGATAKVTEGEMKGFGASLELVSGAVKGFIALEAVRFLVESGKAAIENNKSMVEMARTMETATGANKAQVAQAEKGIKSLSEMSAVLQKDLRPSFDIFYRSTKDTTTALAMQKIALDVSASTGKDLEAVTKAMSRAYEGNTGALAKLVPSVKNAKDPIKALETSFKGAAKAAADADPYKRMQQTFDEIKESLGSALMPIFQSFAKILKDLSPIIEKVAQFISKIVSAVMPAVDAISSALLPVLDALMGILIPIIEAGLTPMTQAITKMLVPALEFISGLLNKTVVPAFQWLADLFDKVLGKAIKNIEIGFKHLGDFLAPFYNSILKPLLDGFAKFTGIDLTKLGSVGKDIKSPELDLSGAGPYTNPNAPTKADPNASRIESFKSWVKAEKVKVAEFHKAWQEKTDAANLAFTEGQKAAQKDRDDALAKLESDHATKMLSIQSDYAQKLQDIVQQSMDRLRNAFQSSTAIDVGAMFAASVSSSDLASVVSTQMKDGIQTAVSFWGSPAAGTGVEGLLKTMTDKLNAAQKLADNAGKLSGAGFSQTFIEQVVAQGGDIGNKMAEQILASTPETQKSLQDVFTKSESVSNSAMDKLSQSIYDKSGLATSGLQKLYEKTQGDLVMALADETDKFTKQQADIKAKYDDQMIALNKTLSDALDAADKALKKQLDSAEAALASKVSSMKGLIGGLSTNIGSLTVGGSKVSTAPVGTGVVFGGGSGYGVQVNNTYNLETAISTNADPQAYQAGLINQLNYGLPVGVVSGGISRLLK